MTPDDHHVHNARLGAERSDAIAAAVRSRLPADANGLAAIDYGCGPGHVGLRLADCFAHMTLADIDPDALADARANAAGLPGVQVLELDLSRETPPGLRADVVLSSMSWHHIRDLGTLADAVARVAPGGRLFVADLDADGGAFHRDEPTFTGHDGFDRSELAGLLTRHRYTDVVVADLWRGEKYTSAGPTLMSLFLLSARMPTSATP